MTQVSARARERKNRGARAARITQAEVPSPAPRRRWWFTSWEWTAAGILFGAAFLRLFLLTAKVFHHDEGVNGNFMVTLFRNGYYHYDPGNYHGPSLYYAALLVTSIESLFVGKAGLNTFALRLVTVIFGMGVVWLMLCLRRQLGNTGAVCAAALAATSSGMVFFSRYFIHEILFIFFSLGAVAAVLRWKESGRPSYLLWASASVALLGTTKETWIITVVVWLLALGCTAVYMRLRTRFGSSIPDRKRRKGAALAEPVTPRQSRETLMWMCANATAVFITIWVVLYSSFFTNFPQGLYDSVLTYTYWFKTSGNANVYGWDKYLEWLSKAELPALVLGSVGTVIALIQARSRFAVFSAFWSLGILTAYSLVPYKTPWLALSIVLPFIIMSGYALEQLYQRKSLKIVAILLAVLAVGYSCYGAVELSFFRYDDETQPYSYAHSKRDLLNLVNEIETIAAGNPAGKQIGITIMSPEHWPLPWYLRDFPNAGYWGKVVQTDQPIVIVHENQKAEAEQMLGDKYRLFSQHDLRPGNRLLLYLRKDVQP